MKKKKLDPVNFCHILDMFGELAARQTFDDVKAGRCKESVIEKYLYDETETKAQYAERLKKELQEEVYGHKHFR